MKSRFHFISPGFLTVVLNEITMLKRVMVYAIIALIVQCFAEILWGLNKVATSNKKGIFF